MSAFDPDQFMSMTVDGANDTEYATIPAGEYPAMIADAKMAEREGKEGNKFYPLDIQWQLINPSQDLINAMGRDKIIVRQSVFVDFTDGGSLDMGKGKNVGLGKLRDALGQNTPGWRPGMLIGAGPATIKVTQGPDKQGVVRNNVTAVGKME